ncbi:MAG: hypothetical protein KKD38_06365, partial [Candidatus Delongbacteria bacterium]|nr:hypothetical protein [Candidatus Delongbacteria bacterium]
FNDTRFVADLPVASGFFIKDNVIIPNRFTEDQPVFATPLGADIFVKILSRSHFPSFEEIRFSLLSVEDYNSLYNDLGTRPYITGYIFNGEKNEPNIKFIMKFYSSRINLNNTLMEFYSKADTFGNFYIKKTF